MPNEVIRVGANGGWRPFANTSAFVQAHPVAHPERDDFEPDETTYSMIAVQDKLYVVQPNHGELDEVSLDGTIRRVLDISASQGHIVPTAVAYHAGNFYVGNLATFPVQHGKAMIYKITPAGAISVVVRGLAAVVGVAFDRQGQLYALETSTVDNQGPVPGTGKVVRVTSAGALETVASGLVLPTAMTFGPDGQLYVSNFGFGLPAGQGQIVRINVQASVNGGGTPTTMPNTGAREGRLGYLVAGLLLLLMAGACMLVMRRRRRSERLTEE